MKSSIKTWLSYIALSFTVVTISTQVHADQACSNTADKFKNILSTNQYYRVNANMFNVPNNSKNLCIDHSYESTKIPFTVRNKGVSINTGGAPMGYPSVYAGCHYGACTKGFGSGRQLKNIRSATTTWVVAGTGASGIWNAAYDVWFHKSQNAPTDANPNGLELMIWINHKGSANPAGSKERNNVTIGGATYEVWIGNVAVQTSKVITYRATRKVNKVENLNLKSFFDDAKRRNLLNDNWYLTSIQAGFEVWQGGDGLRNDYFFAETK